MTNLYMMLETNKNKVERDSKDLNGQYGLLKVDKNNLTKQLEAVQRRYNDLRGRYHTLQIENTTAL